MNPEIKNDNPQPPTPQVDTTAPVVQPTQPVNPTIGPTEPNSTQERPLTQGGVVVSGGIDPLLMPKPATKRSLIYLVAGVALIAILLLGGIYFAINKIASQSENKTAQKTASSGQKSQSTNQSASQTPAASASQLADSKRKSNLDDVSSLLDSYASKKARFPMLSQINDPSFRAQNLPTLDDSLLKDPDGTQSVLAATPTKGAYSYAVTDRDGKACDNIQASGHTSIPANYTGPFLCTKYMLTAILSDGTTYQKTGEAP